MNSSEVRGCCSVDKEQLGETKGAGCVISELCICAPAQRLGRLLKLNHDAGGLYLLGKRINPSSLGFLVPISLCSQSLLSPIQIA